MFNGKTHDISMAIVNVANCKRLPGRVNHMDVSSSKSRNFMGILMTGIPLAIKNQCVGAMGKSRARHQRMDGHEGSVTKRKTGEWEYIKARTIPFPMYFQ